MKGIWYLYINNFDPQTVFSAEVSDAYRSIKPVAMGLFYCVLLILISGCTTSDVETPLPLDDSSATEDQARALSFDTVPVIPTKDVDSSQFSDLPNGAQDKILLAIATDLDIAAEDVLIESVSAQTWPDGCLGLANPDEFCTMALVNGWQIVVSQDGESTIVYRSDSNGLAVRRAN